MDSIRTASDLLSALSSDCSDEDLLLSSFQALIGAEISMKRQDLGLSQKDLADLMGVSQALVSRWEKGDTNYTLETLCRLALKLDIEMQSPFVPRPSAIPYRPVMNNITHISAAPSWRPQNTLSQIAGTYTTSQLEEM